MAKELPSVGAPADLEFMHDMVEMNEALTLGAVRQHELAEAAESLNGQLRTEIIDRTHAESAMRVSEVRFRALFELGPVAVYSCDAAGVILEFNRRAAELWGRAPALGDTDEHFCGSYKLFRPDGRFMPHAECPMAEVIAGKIPGAKDAEVLIERPDGSRVTVVVNIRHLKDERGEIMGAINCFYDISERKLSEEALRASEERSRILFDAAPMAVFVCDRDAVLRQYNQRAVELWGREPVCGAEKHCGSVKLWLPDGTLLPHEQSPMLEVLRTGEPVRNVEVDIERPDGSRLPVLVNFAALRNAQGEITGVITSFMDISERRVLEDALVARAAELAQADRNKDEFLAMLAHELRNPLAPLRNAAAILQHTDATAEEQTQAQNVLARQIENMTRMIDDLLDVSRITEGKIELRPQVVLLEAIVNAAAGQARSGIEARNQELAISLPSEPIFLHADATRLEQVLGNLLGNACKYSEAGGHISVSVERAAVSGKMPPGVIVRIRDDGIGIAPELLPHIFDLFVQATRAPDRAQGGLGIGLTLVERIVKMHGGIVEARSDGLGHGSEFIVRLPVLASPQSAEIAPAAANLRESPCRMLIVDDNEDSARSMSTLQRLRGHETRIAFTGPDALAMAAEFLPEVVLLDIGLPGMDGYEVARRFRAMPELGDPFLVAMSGYGNAEDRANAAVAGFDEYMVKPVDLAVLRRWLRDRGGALPVT